MNSAEELVHFVLNLKSLNYKVTMKMSADSSREVNHVISCWIVNTIPLEHNSASVLLMSIHTNTIILRLGQLFA